MSTRTERIQEVLRGFRTASPDIIGASVVSIGGVRHRFGLAIGIDEELVSAWQRTVWRVAIASASRISSRAVLAHRDAVLHDTRCRDLCNDSFMSCPLSVVRAPLLSPMRGCAAASRTTGCQTTWVSRLIHADSALIAEKLARYFKLGGPLKKLQRSASSSIQ